METLAAISDLAIATGREVTDPELKLALDRASSRFRMDVGHSVTQEIDHEIWLDGSGGVSLMLPAAPITDIAITLDGRPLVERVDYSVSRQTAMVFRTAGKRWPRAGGNVNIVYTHGYAEVPEGIADAVLEHAVTLAESYAHVAQESATSTSITYGAQATVGLTQKWVNAVRMYKLEGRS